MSGPRLLEFAGPARVRHLESATNVRIIRRRKDQQIVEIHLLDCGNDGWMEPARGDPRRLVHHSDSENNPPNVWSFKRGHKVDTLPLDNPPLQPG